MLSAGQFVLTPGLTLAWQESGRLRHNKAHQLIQAERALRPDNLMADVVELQMHFQKALASGSAGDEDVFQQKKNKLQEQLQAVRPANAWQQWALGYSGVSSLMLRMRAGNHWQSAMELRKTYSTIIDAYAKFPGFVPNKLTYGIMQVALGSVPEQFNWALRLASLQGDSQEGIAQLRHVMQLPDNHPFAFMRADAAILLGMATRAMQTDHVVKNQVINGMRSMDPENLMLQYTLAYLLMRDGRNEEALQTLHDLPSSEEYIEFPLTSFLMGEALLRKGSAQAGSYYLRFLASTSGTMYVADAHRKLAWIALQNGDINAYRSHMQQCRQAPASPGERDAEAKREASLSQIPHPELITVRLRFDGGYFAEAEKILLKLEPELGRTDNPHHLEFLYRYARNAEGLGQTSKALSLYAETYRIGRKSPEYYAANAALRIALIYEQQGNRAEAANWYNNCLSLKPAVYRSSIHAAARAGLRRVGT